MMSDEARNALTELIRQYMAEMQADHEAARREAIEAGFSTETGELTECYGGTGHQELAEVL
jgi:hypothetical protein